MASMALEGLSHGKPSPSKTVTLRTRNRSGHRTKSSPSVGGWTAPKAYKADRRLAKAGLYRNSLAADKACMTRRRYGAEVKTFGSWLTTVQPQWPKRGSGTLLNQTRVKDQEISSPDRVAKDKTPSYGGEQVQTVVCSSLASSTGSASMISFCLNKSRLQSARLGFPIIRAQGPNRPRSETVFYSPRRQKAVHKTPSPCSSR